MMIHAKAMMCVLALCLSFALSTAYAEPSLPHFLDYPVFNLFKGKPADVDFKNNVDARRFRNTIRDGAKKGSNFAGHYALISWGCGIMCQSFIIVDSITGEIHSSPFGTSTGICNRLDSTLLIVNPITPDVLEDGKIPQWLTTRYYKWDGKALILIKESKSIMKEADSCDNSEQ